MTGGTDANDGGGGKTKIAHLGELFHTWLGATNRPLNKPPEEFARSDDCWCWGQRRQNYYLNDFDLVEEMCTPNVCYVADEANATPKQYSDPICSNALSKKCHSSRNLLRAIVARTASHVCRERRFLYDAPTTLTSGLNAR